VHEAILSAFSSTAKKTDQEHNNGNQHGHQIEQLEKVIMTTTQISNPHTCD
jgi:hypothetical protein